MRACLGFIAVVVAAGCGQDAVVPPDASRGGGMASAGGGTASAGGSASTGAGRAELFGRDPIDVVATFGAFALIR